MNRGKEHFRVKVFTGLKEGDTLIEVDDDYKSGYGKGFVSDVFDNGMFMVKFPDRKYPVMFLSNGIRWDKESKKGSRRIKTPGEVDGGLFNKWDAIDSLVKKPKRDGIAVDFIDMYAVEIIGKNAYTERMTTETAYGKQRGNDFEGTEKECLEFIGRSSVDNIYGYLADKDMV